LKALILAAGYATRLYPLTLETPKPLLEVCGKTIMQRIMEKAVESGIVEEFIVVSNSRFYKKFEDFFKNYSPGVPVRLLNDGSLSNDDRLGAVADINFALKQAGYFGDLLLLAGDIIFDFSIKPMVESFLEEKREILALFDVKSLALAKRFGIAQLDREKRIDSFIEKPENPKSTLASTAFYILGEKALSMIPEFLETSGKKDAIGFLFEWLLGKGVILYGFEFNEGKWFDIGSLESLESARKHFQH